MNPPTLPYEDRKTLLIVFGILTLLLGLFIALLVPLMIVGQTMSAQAVAPPRSTILPAVVIYGGMAVALIWLGIGSIMARRWARALLLVFSWSWLIMGLVMLITGPFTLSKAAAALPTHGQPNSPPGWAFVLLPMILIGISCVMIPGIWVLVYRSRHVKSTCEALDPVERWTDRCPLPVLAVPLWLALGVPMMALLAFSYHGVIPAFGSFISGLAGSAVYLLIAAVWTWCAWSLYRLETRGWWILLVTIVLFTISSFMTYSRHDVSELYQLMGYSEAMIVQMKKMSVFQGTGMAWMSFVGTIPFVAYLFFIRRYLRTA